MPATVPPLRPVPASEPGALPGFATTCSSCGTRISASLRTIAEAERVAHLAWHARQGS